MHGVFAAAGYVWLCVVVLVGVGGRGLQMDMALREEEDLDFFIYVVCGAVEMSLETCADALEDREGG